ncbi:MAG: malate synthase G [Pelagibacterales bacterium]|nr:malate synthase G [Pelagibacterales bacterium]OUU62866.1 MAG: malate synthase G [Alphaproteobacteria bacterium TMED62]|tara:strand:- start:1344 stop:3503 length:2160 start_codon:yes stop_codon:yes gene_type:complete
MVNRIEKYGLKIEENLFNFINVDVLDNLNFKQNDFWKSFSNFIIELAPINNSFLDKRLTLKRKIDSWHKENKDNEFNLEKYKEFLQEIGYLIPEGNDFSINTSNVDKEISNICGPQLVVPITNARYALNAANARWGSLYDALYGTDLMGTLPNKGGYDELRGSEVISYARNYLDRVFPLNNYSWSDISKIEIISNSIKITGKDNNEYTLINDSHYLGHRYNNNILSEIVLEKNNLKIRILINKEDAIGKNDPADIADIILESAISTIMDCEDSVATVDAEDKILAYKNWLGLMQGNLESKFIKYNNTLTRKLNEDIVIINKIGEQISLKSRSLMLIRNVGHLMTNPAILYDNDKEIPEGLMDAMFTTLIGIFDLNKKSGPNNSEKKSIYIVKPKMHGPEEVAFTNTIFTKVEEILNLPENTVKLGIMDEERRTSVNLMECIRAASNRVAFINTGFLDRTGDEIHTSTEAGPFLKKGDMKTTEWIRSYEDRNVDIGLKCGLQGKAQIGKGMWAMPDLMKDMYKIKIEHPHSGANCAWVPSPTAATIHAMHYHMVNVKEVQNNIIKGGSRGTLDNLLTIPTAEKKNWNKEDILLEVENNSQSILGYVVRWVDQGVGCSKVPDIKDIGLMEDRATCRISSQILANWLKHDIITKEEVIAAMKKMAKKVDDQNEHDKYYKKMSDTFDTNAFKAACRLVLEGSIQPSGYTEPILHEMRLKEKAL